MKRIVFALLLLVAPAAGAAEVVVVESFELHSSFWTSLHQTLMADVLGLMEQDLSELSEDERTAWTKAVEAYRS
ncbi:MAG: hypothetical protein R3338_06155, partial [Thermoanaerobaculia bacterium]|nr:hypothetical protein [Thermoanaerobaculia bacterium]